MDVDIKVVSVGDTTDPARTARRELLNQSAR
jgi:hypothetical protein